MYKFENPMHNYLSCFKDYLSGVLVFSIIINLLYLVPTLYMLQIYERVIPTQGYGTLLLLSLFTLSALTVLALFDRIRARLLVRAGLAFDQRFSPSLIHQSVSDPAFHKANIIREFDRIRNFFGSPLLPAIFDLILFPVYLIACFTIHPLIGLLVLTNIAVLGLLLLAFERRLHARMSEVHGAMQATYAVQDQIERSRDDIVALGMSERLTNRISTVRSKAATHQIATTLSAVSFISWSKFGRLFFQSLTLAVGAWLAIEGSITVGGVFASALLVTRASGPVEQILVSWRQLFAIGQSFSRVSSYFDKFEPKRTMLPAPSGSIRVESLTFRQADDRPPVLADISFALEPGSVMGVVGPNGAGKSSLLRILTGVIGPFDGEVQLDGAAMHQWSTDNRNRCIGYLPQRPSLLAGSVKDNISRFDAGTQDPAQVDKAVVQAAQAAGAHSFILTLKDGYDHVLQHGATNVSLGQAQWIALARAFYGNPRYLLLDEPSAHMDAEGEERLLQVLKQVRNAGVTMLIVSHRRALLALTDQLMVMQEGRIVALGPRQLILKEAPTNRSNSANRAKA